MSCLPNSNEGEGEVIPSDADIPGSIATTLFDALQERRTGKNLPPAMILVARIRATQLHPMLDNEKRTIRRYGSSNLGPLLPGAGPIRSDQRSRQKSVHGEPYVRVYLESTEYRCAYTDKQQ